MSAGPTPLAALEKQLAVFKSATPGLKKDDYLAAFVCHAIAATDVNDALNHVVGKAGDGGIDAYYVDDRIQVVFIFQVKYRKNTSHRERVASLRAWVERTERLITSDTTDSFYIEELKTLNADAKHALKRIRSAWGKGYRTILHFASTGTIADSTREEAQDRITDDTIVFEATDHRELPALIDSFINGFAPAIPQIDIPLHNQLQPLKVVSGASPPVDTRVLWTDGASVAKLYETYTRRLFELNIRGFLQGPIADAITSSVLQHPDSFFYQNNGITFVCEKAIRRDEKLTLIRPQIVNGQQTTRSLHLAWKTDKKKVEASKVLVKIVAVPHRKGKTGDQSAFLSTVRRIVEASNRQNAISARDLIANDPRQIQIERELGALGYTYVRKKMHAEEIARVFADQPIRRIKLDDVVRILGSSELENYVGTIGPSETLDDAKDGDSYDRMFRPEVTGLSIAIRYELFEKIKALIRKPRNSEPKPYNKAKWPMLYVSWKQLSNALDKSNPVLQSLSRLQPKAAESSHQKAVVSYIEELRQQMDGYRAMHEKNHSEPVELSRFFDRRFSAKDFEQWQKQTIRAGKSNHDRVAALASDVETSRPTR